MTDEAIRDQIREAVVEAMEDGWTRKEILDEVEYQIRVREE